MAIGTTAAILGAAAIGAGASVLGSSAQSKAAGKAADASNAAAQMQYDLGQQSLALNQGIYNQNYALGSPFIANGLGASNAMSALLGISPAAVPQNTLGSSTALGSGTVPTGGTTPVGTGNGVLAALSGGNAGPNPFGGTNDLAMPTSGPQANMMSTKGVQAGTLADRPRLADYRGDPRAFMQALQGWRAGEAPTAGGAAPAAGGAAPSAQSAFENFANSAGMQFQLDQGADMLNNRYAAAGALQSGAAMKAMNDYAQDTALNRYFMPYMGMLQGQQNMGAGMASSVMGVGTNFGNTAANINNSMGNAAANNAANLGNIYTNQGNNQANMWNNLGSSFGYALGGIGG